MYCTTWRSLYRLNYDGRRFAATIPAFERAKSGASLNLIIRVPNKLKGVVVKNSMLLLCILLIPTLSLAEDLSLIRKDKDEVSYYEPHTIRRTGQFVMAWVVTLIQSSRCAYRLFGGANL